jgi:hypothetical protein
MSLTLTAKFAKKSAKWLVAFVAGYYLVVFFLIPRGRELVYQIFFDREPPNPVFGQLEPLKFVRFPIANSTVKPEYVLSTNNGRLPVDLPKKMPVYEFRASPYSYLAAKRAQDEAAKLGFKDNELITDLKGRVFKWRSLVSGGILSIDTETQQIDLQTNLYDKSSEFEQGSLTADRARQYAYDLFNGFGMINSKIFKTENFNAYLGMYAGSNIIQTTTANDAQVARVELIAQTGKYPIYGPDSKKGLLSVVLRTPRGNSAYNYPIVEAHYMDIAPSTLATYPIISVQSAWKAVSAGNGIISNLTPKTYDAFKTPAPIALSRILINAVYLAYYETPEFQKYMQPIYVFGGKYIAQDGTTGDITIYYPAITAEFVK